MFSILQRTSQQSRSNLARGPVRQYLGGMVTPSVATAAPSFSSLLQNSTISNHNNISLDQQVRHRSNRSRRGLYDGVDIRFGNRVSFSEKKTRRKFKPNVFKKRLYSEILDEMIRFHVTAKALRTIDKYGGLDNYLLHNKHIKDGEGEGGAAKARIQEVLEQRREGQRQAAMAAAQPESEDGEAKMETKQQ